MILLINNKKLLLLLMKDSAPWKMSATCDSLIKRVYKYKITNGSSIVRADKTSKGIPISEAVPTILLNRELYGSFPTGVRMMTKFWHSKGTVTSFYYY